MKPAQHQQRQQQQNDVTAGFMLSSSAAAELIAAAQPPSQPAGRPAGQVGVKSIHHFSYLRRPYVARRKVVRAAAAGKLLRRSAPANSQ